MILVGDIHGDIIRMQRIVHMAGDEHIIFVGDFLDSFVYDIYDQIKCIDFAIRLVEEGKATVITGNHELSYMHPKQRCSGYNEKTKHLLQQENRLIKMFDLFKPYVFFEDKNLLVTHAGLTKEFAREYAINLWNLKARLDEFAERPTEFNPLFNVGRGRFGNHANGGIYWCDWNVEFNPIEGLRQVFGHTAVRDIRELDGNYNIDCLHVVDKVLKYDEQTDTLMVVEF